MTYEPGCEEGKVWYCENGHHNMGANPERCDECGQELELAPESLPVFGQGILLSSGTAHNMDKQCGSLPATGIRTDLGTAAVSGDVKLCGRCEWPESAEKVME